MRKIIAAATLFLVCTALVALPADPTADLKAADQGWSKAAEAKNIEQFMGFVGDDAFMSGLDGKWIRGKAAVKELWSTMLADPSFKVSWTVDTAEVSKDGTLGYTRGTFQASQGGKPVSGSYTTVWKKSQGGKWLVVVDS